MVLNRGADTDGAVLGGRDPGVVGVLPGRGAGLCACRTPPALRAHHDRLLRVEVDLDEVLDLMELAVTWGELDWSSVGVVPPEQWSELVANHEWRDVERVRRLFGLAEDVAVRSAGAATHDLVAGVLAAEG